MSDVIKMKWHLNNAFKDRSPKKCITFHDGDFYIKDDEKSGCEALLLETVSDTDSLFHIINPNLKQIALFKVDKCFFGSKPDHKRCDCIVFDDVFDEYVLEFIEDYSINIFETNEKTF